MNSLFHITIDDYLEVTKMAKANGKKPGESMEEEFAEYVRLKNLKPCGHTELTKEELIKEHASHGESILDISTNKEGKQQTRIIKPKDTP